MTPDLTARMFGADRVCDATVSTDGNCQPTTGAQGWIEGVNASLANGRCEGMAVLSQLMFLGDLKAKDFGADTARDLTLARNFDLQRELAYWFATQLVPGVVKNEKYMPKDVLPFLASFLKPGATESYRIGMVQKLPTGFGLSHSLTPIGYAAGESDGIYYIRVYDNNFPGAERAIRLDVKNDTWAYDGVSSGGPVAFTGGGASKNPLYFAPVHARMGKLPCPFCDDSTTSAVLAAGAVQVAARDMAGNTNGIVDGEVVESAGGSVSPGFGLCVDNQCSDGSPITVITAPKMKDETLKLQIAPGDPTMMAQGTSTVRVGSGTASTTISGVNVMPGTADVVTVSNGGQSVNYQSASQQPVTITSQFKLTNGNVVNVTVDVKGPSTGVTIDVDPDSGKVSAKTEGAAGTPIVIDVESLPTEASGTGGKAQITTTGTSSGTVAFDAGDVGKTSTITATVQQGDAAPTMVKSNSCISAAKDADETDVDCGGPTCGKCGQDKACNVDGDCVSGVCRATSSYNATTKQQETVNRCQTTCENGKKDGDETDVDCGGACTSHACATGKACAKDGDCAAGAICADDHVCRVVRDVMVESSGEPGTFTMRLKPDGTRDDWAGGKTLVNTQTITSPGTGAFFFTRLVGPWSVEITSQPKGVLCAPDVASGDVTGLPPGPVAVHVTCTKAVLPCGNGAKDGQETDVDCGGADCRAEAAFCASGKACLVDADCGNPSVKSICDAGACAATKDVSGYVSGLADSTEQVKLRLVPQGTLTDATAYREVVVQGALGLSSVSYSMLNTRITGTSASLQIVSSPAGKTCKQTTTGVASASRISIVNVECTAIQVVPQCADGVKGQNETDVDCGGADCTAMNKFCGEGKGCATDADCGAAGGVARICSAAKICATTFDVMGEVRGDFDQLELKLTPAGTRNPSSTTAVRTLTIPVKADPNIPTPFTFDNTRVTAADTYAVTVSKAPNNATCTVMNGTGTATSNVAGVVVNCVVDTTPAHGWSALSTTGFGGAAESHRGLFQAAKNDVWATGAGTVVHFDGTSWTDEGVGLAGLQVYGISGTAPDAIWVAAEGNILKKWNGTSWFTLTTGLFGGTNLYAVSANAASGLVYVVGAGAAVASNSDLGGDNLASEDLGFPPPTSSDLHGVWVTDTGRVFAVGDAGALIWKGDLGTWSSTSAFPTTNDLRGVWASADDDAWAVGAGGTIVHFDGTDWTLVTSPVTTDLNAVWGASKQQVWCAGAGGTVLFYDGTSWTKETTASIQALSALSGLAGGETPFVVGDQNTFMQRH
jgi:hypothetical protein